MGSRAWHCILTLNPANLGIGIAKVEKKRLEKRMLVLPAAGRDCLLVPVHGALQPSGSRHPKAAHFPLAMWVFAPL